MQLVGRVLDADLPPTNWIDESRVGGAPSLAHASIVAVPCRVPTMHVKGTGVSGSGAGRSLDGAESCTEGNDDYSSFDQLKKCTSAGAGDLPSPGTGRARPCR
jgi:hypothetical protein